MPRHPRWQMLILLCLIAVGNATAQTTPQYRFASGDSSLSVPFELANNLILLKVRVNNSRPLHFLLDTGASVSVIDPQTARALGLRSQGKLTLEATGGDVQSGLTRAVTLSIQGVSVFKQTLAIIDLDAAGPLFGFKIDGIIGHDFINNFVVEIDYASGVMNFYEPEQYRYSGTGESIPIELVEKTPFTRARIVLQGREPVEGKFEVDTGGNGILSLNTPFVNKHKLLESLASAAQSKLGGAGGTSEAVKAHVEAVELGKLAIKNPLVVFAQGTEGNEGSTASDGELGGGFFSDFKLILDYSRSRVILERNENRALAKDLSGLEIFAEPPRFRTFVVNQVAQNSPGAAAGIQEEDTILSIDSRPTSRLTLRSLRLILTHPGDHLLSLKRGPKTLQLRMRL
jgi:predicted aspartyl protease